MEQGPSINPVTLRPKQLYDREQSQIHAVKHEQSLRSKAENIDIVHSETGSQYLEVIRGKLQARITHLVKSDAEAQAYETLLNELGFKYNAAKAAIDELHKRQFK